MNINLWKHRKTFQRRLLAWYERTQRPLPWRKTTDPYKIWVSEIMLQQTQVSTVVDYYQRFTERFPTVESLASAGTDQVMKSWEGLGYYSRARNLHQAARLVVREGSGIPGSVCDLMRLPGIGRYTAGAIASIAFGKRAAVLDGNVIRVLTRIFHVTDSVSSNSVRERLWNMAEDLLPENRVDRFNQALMELGALVCRPRPDCSGCPVADFCLARRLGIQDGLPVKAPRKTVPHVEVTAGIIWRDQERFLITLRPPHGLLGGLWEFPGGKRKENETLEDSLVREIREELAVEVEPRKRFCSVNHAYSHFRITLHVFHCHFKGGRIRCRGVDDYRWVTVKDLGRYAFPAADRKVIDRLLNEGGYA